MVFRLAGPTARVDRRSRDEEARKTCTCIDVDLKIAANIGREAADIERGRCTLRMTNDTASGWGLRFLGRFSPDLAKAALATFSVASSG